MTNSHRQLLLIGSLVTMLWLPAIGQTPAPAITATSRPAPSLSSSSTFALEHDRIEALWKSGPQEAWFARSFLEKVPFAQISPVLAQVRAVLGAYRATTGNSGVYVSRFDKGTQEVRIHLDSDQKIDGLFLPPPKLAAATFDDALRRLRRLPGTKSYVVIEGHSQRAAFNADRPLAVGSAFKLGLLAALRDEIRRGHRHWEDVVPLDVRWVSLPTGILQTWPVGTPLTVAAYAVEMISISDNTAADAVAALAGETAIKRYASRNNPFLTTREFFILRSPVHKNILLRWIAAKPGERVAMGTLVANMPLPDSPEFFERPADLRLEWLYSTRELCELMERVADLPLMRINPGFATASDFSRVAYKGGSEPGVLSAVTSVVTRSGQRACIAVTVNDAMNLIDLSSFATAYESVLTAIATKRF